MKFDLGGPSDGGGVGIGGVGYFSLTRLGEQTQTSDFRLQAQGLFGKGSSELIAHGRADRCRLQRSEVAF